MDRGLKVADLPLRPANQLLQYTPYNNSGSWSQVGFPSTSNFSTLVRTYATISAFGGGLGFALGGVENAATTDSFSDTASTTPVPGLVMYNMTSQEWFNVSASEYTYSGEAADGAAHFVPLFGSIGLLFIIGGTVANGVSLPSTDFVWMFDPLSQQWSSQEVSGTKPSQVINPCVVGVQRDDNTYEVRRTARTTDSRLMICHLDIPIRRPRR